MTYGVPGFLLTILKPSCACTQPTCARVSLVCTWRHTLMTQQRCRCQRQRLCAHLSIARTPCGTLC